MNGRLLWGAQKIVDECLAVKPGECVLIVSDHNIEPNILVALRTAAKSRDAIVNMLIAEPGERPGEEPSELISDAMKRADVVIGATTRTLWHTNAATEACATGARLITLTECTERTLSSGAIEADLQALQPVIQRLLRVLDQGSIVHVTAEGGTDLRLDIGGRRAYACSGICDKPGDKMGFPDLEVYIAPNESSTQGAIVIDASSSGIGLVKAPLRLEIKDGVVTRITGGEEAAVLQQILASADSDSAFVVAEFAFGLNDKAKVVGSVIEDEGVYGTGHFALGNNVHFGGTNQAPIHIDMVYWRPTIELDGRYIMINGELVESETVERGMR